MIGFLHNCCEDSGIFQIGGRALQSPHRRRLPPMMWHGPEHCFGIPGWSEGFGLLASSLIQGKDKNHSALCPGFMRAIKHVRHKLPEKLLGYSVKWFSSPSWTENWLGVQSYHTNEKFQNNV